MRYLPDRVHAACSGTIEAEEARRGLGPCAFR